MPINNNRLLLELEKHRREINRAIINPQFPKLALEDLEPLLRMMAHARADYVRELLEIAQDTNGQLPTQAQVERLKGRRETFDELVAAINSLETLIQREYLDVKPTQPRTQP